MPRTTTTYDVFISSPSDVLAERDVAQEAIELINRTTGLKDNFKLNPILWENDVSSQIGGQPQDIINEQIGDDYDIFLGLLCNRFGQKTEKYGSGTEEEFRRALNRSADGNIGPEIMFFFKDVRRSESPVDAEQYLMVEKFRKEIASIGIYQEFETLENLKTQLVLAITKAIGRLTERIEAGGSDQPQKLESDATHQSPKNAIVKISDFDEDIGILELIDSGNEATERLVQVLGSIADATETLGSRVSKKAAEIQTALLSTDNKQNQKSLRKILESVAAEIQRYSHRLDQYTPDARRDFSSLLRCMQHAIVLADQDDLSGPDDVDDFVHTLTSLQNSMRIAYDQISELRNGISSIQRLTTKLNQAKRHANKSISDFLDFLSESSSNIDTTLEALT